MRAHLFDRYAGPLAAYARISPTCRIAEPDELVHGFLVRTLEDCSTIARWSQSGRLLRRWLLAGLRFHARSLARELGRFREVSATDSLDLQSGSEPTAEAAFERECAREILEAAFVRAQDAMTQAQRDQAWVIFRRHVLEGEAYSTIARALQVNVQHCADATRLATKEVRKALRGVLLDEGVPEREVGAECDSILKSVIDATSA